MGITYIDIHPHIIARDDVKYPRAPLFGVQSDWSRERPVTVEGLIAEMDAAGVHKAAIVQASTCYGFDNSYLCDSIAKYPKRLSAVGSVDLTAPDVKQTIKAWKDRGVEGLRLFTGGSTKAFDPTTLDLPESFPAWEYCAEIGMSMCLQTDPAGHSRVAGLAKRFPTVKVLLDHCGRADWTDGAPFNNAAEFLKLADLGNVYLKITPRVFVESAQGKATHETVFAKLVSTFGSNHLAWGTNFPATAGPVSKILDTAKAGLSSLSAADQAWIFGKTAQTLYPSLAD
jgi:predicted TIM-barrel fold metal-dependent hydrolase